MERRARMKSGGRKESFWILHCGDNVWAFGHLVLYLFNGDRHKEEDKSDIRAQHFSYRFSQKNISVIAKKKRL